MGRLVVEGDLRCRGSLLGRDHLLLGLLLQLVALIARLHCLIAVALRGIPGRDGVFVHRLVALEELVHRSQAREQFVCPDRGSREEQLHRGVFAAVAVELRGDAPSLLCGFIRCCGLLISLRLQVIGALGGVEVRLLRDIELVREPLRFGQRTLDLGREALNQPLDAGDLTRLGGFVRLRVLDVVPAGI